MPSSLQPTGTAMVRLFDDLDALAADAAGALDRARQPSLYDSLDWLRRTHEHVMPDAQLAIARATSGTDRCWLPLTVDGGRGRALASWYTLSFAPIFDAAPSARTMLLEAIARTLRRSLARLELAPIPAEDADALAGSFAAAGWWVSAQDTTANWVAHTVDKNFATYWTERPSRLRNTWRRKAKAAPLDIAIRSCCSDEDWAAYERVYTGSWKPDEGSPAFMRAFARDEAAAGTLRLGIARRAGEPVAAQLWTVEHGRAIIHKLAYLESERAASPGTILSEAMFRHVIDRDRPALIDFGTGDDGYKADWMDERRMLRVLTLHNGRSIAGLAAAARAAGAAWVRGLRDG